MKIITLLFFLFFTLANSESFEQKNKLDTLFNQLETVNNFNKAEELEKKNMAGLE
jgi:hypothetical protein